MSEPKVRVKFKSFLQSGYCFIGLSGVQEILPFERVGSQIKRVEFSGAFNFAKRFRVMSRV